MARATDGRELAPGLIHYPGYLDARAQERLADEVSATLAEAPPYTPRMPRSGRPFSVRMSNAGPLGWVSDIGGYRYQATYPETGRSWPAMPASVLAAWRDLADCPGLPEACLINLYPPGARMGLHQDRDEAELTAPVLSLSLGASASFRYGGMRRSDPTRSVRLDSGDALVIGGPSRLAYHGIDRLLASEGDLFGGGGHESGSSVLAALAPHLGLGGRCNLTLRRVTPFDAGGGA